MIRLDGPASTEPRHLYSEILRLRGLLETVAQDLERIACEERYARHVDPLRERARRIRAHLHRSRDRGFDG
jgi:hypothetical protein